MHAGQPRVLSGMCTRSGTICRVPTAVLYATKCCVTSHDPSAGLLFQASNIGEWYTKKVFSSSIILATLNFWWEFPFNIRPTFSLTSWANVGMSTSHCETIPRPTEKLAVWLRRKHHNSHNSKSQFSFTRIPGGGGGGKKYPTLCNSY